MLHYWKSPADNDAEGPCNGLGWKDRSHRRLIIILLLRKTNIINGIHKRQRELLEILKKLYIAFSQRSSSPLLIKDETDNDSDIINTLMDYEGGQEGPDSLRVDKNLRNPASQQIGEAFS
ncbi:hypothetical protein TNCV_1050241 [Trichonephila clavipes]|nr:hypothetical protein TNCV_1050241 [Trichonephila clavipes]